MKLEAQKNWTTPHVRHSAVHVSQSANQTVKLDTEAVANYHNEGEWHVHLTKSGLTKIG